MRILFVASEGLPFSKTGGLADVVEALPKALAAQGHEVAVVLPRYRGTEPASLVLPSLTIPMGGGRLRFPAIVNGALVGGVRYFFVDDPGYFDREGLYASGGRDYPDNAERYSEFCRASIELAKHIWLPDVFHCHDWQTALVPVLLRTSYSDDPLVKNIPVVFTIHNMGYHGQFPREVLDRVGIPATAFHLEGLEFYGGVNLLKGGLVYSDYLTTVSRKYAQEIQTREFGYGLDGVARKRADRLVGILNGVDYGAWDPAKDALIAANYSAKDLTGKQTCKQDLLQTFGLPQEHLERPVIGIVSRFADQKGFDLIAEKAHELMKEDLVLVVLGTGDKKYERLFGALAVTYPDRVGLKIAYDNTLAHKVEAGADMFLMPSRYEPSGLNQMYSLKYGTVPIVRATGGLDDSIQTFDVEHGTGTGFKFKEYSGEALLSAVRQALHHYMDERIWKRIQLNGMAKDFSWKGPAREFANLYEAARVSRGFAPTVQKREKPEKAVKAEAEGQEKIAGAEKELKSEAPARRGARKAAQAAQISQETREASQSPPKSEQGKGQKSQEPAQEAPDSVKESQSSGPQALEGSGQAPRVSAEGPNTSGQAPQGSGQAGRNQKPATTSN
ncbi:MAG TPA: glycogen synthase GlgA [Candidatus Acidoferrum sp.]|nr:glycogen synthase GlgA [Candidatus Acidoferrum sp.]